MNKLVYFIFICLTGFLVSCGLNSISSPDPLDESIGQEINQTIKAHKLDVLLADLDSNDPQKVEAYKTQLSEVIAVIAGNWKVEPDQLVINSYTRSQLSESTYKGYQYQHNKLVTLNTVPLHIKNSFDGVFVCYSADYWKQFADKTQGLTLPMDTLGHNMRFEIIQLK